MRREREGATSGKNLGGALHRLSSSSDPSIPLTYRDSSLHLTQNRVPIHKISRGYMRIFFGRLNECPHFYNVKSLISGRAKPPLQSSSVPCCLLLPSTFILLHSVATLSQIPTIRRREATKATCHRWRLCQGLVLGDKRVTLLAQRNGPTKSIKKPEHAHIRLKVKTIRDVLRGSLFPFYRVSGSPRQF